MSKNSDYTSLTHVSKFSFLSTEEEAEVLDIEACTAELDPRNDYAADTKFLIGIVTRLDAAFAAAQERLELYVERIEALHESYETLSIAYEKERAEAEKTRASLASDLDKTRALLGAALARAQTARAEALEEAAKVCEKDDTDTGNGFADRIRALATQTKTEGEG